MRVIGLAVTIALSFTLAPFAAEAQPAGKIPRIGVLAAGTVAGLATRHEALRQGLRELGYVEGQNIIIEARHAEGRLERLPPLAAELVRLNVDLIITSGDHGIRAARSATQTIPIVVALTGDLVRPGYVASLARPGGNITGLTTFGPELSAKRLEFLKATFPKATRVVVVLNPDNTANVTAFKEMEATARALGLQLREVNVRKSEDLAGAFQIALRGRPNAMIALGDAVLLTPPARIVDFAAKNRLPAMYAVQDFVDAGGLMYYGPNVADMYRRAATFVDRILKGSNPAYLPIEQPTKFELVINMKTAKALGLTIPQSVLFRADQIIE